MLVAFASVVSPPDGAELGKEFKIVSVERVGTSSTGIESAVAATERLVQYSEELEGVLPAGASLIAMYESCPTKTKEPVVYALLEL